MLPTDKKGGEPDLMAAVRGHPHLATPFVSRKRPRKADAGDPDAGAGNENDPGNEADTFRGFPPGVTRVYGDGCLFPTIPAGAKLLIAGSHETLKKLPEKGGDWQPDNSLGEKYARKSNQRKGGEGGMGAVTALVSQISGVSARTVKRAPQECAGRKAGVRKYGSP